MDEEDEEYMVHVSGDRVYLKDVKITAQTDMAVMCEMPDGEEVWIPQSQIDDESEIWKRGHEGTLVISRWLAEKKGMV